MVPYLLGNLAGLALGGGSGGGWEGSTDLRGRLRNFMTVPVGGVGWARVAGREGGGRDDGGEGGGGFGGFLSGRDGGTGGPEGRGGGGGCVDGGGGEVGGGGISGGSGRVVMGGGREAGRGGGTSFSGALPLDGGGRDEGGGGGGGCVEGGGGGGGVTSEMGEGARWVFCWEMEESLVGMGGGVGDFFSTLGAMTGVFSTAPPWGLTGGGLTAVLGATAGLFAASENILALARTPALLAGGDSSPFSPDSELLSVFGAGIGRAFRGEGGGG